MTDKDSMIGRPVAVPKEKPVWDDEGCTLCQWCGKRTTQVTWADNGLWICNKCLVKYLEG